MLEIIKAPSLVRHAHSLYDVATHVSDTDFRWMNGVNFTPHGCAVIFAHEAGCWAPREGKGIQECPGLAVFHPYVLEISLEWSMGDLHAGPKDIVQEALDVGGSAVVERLIEKPITGLSGTITVPPVGGSIFQGGIQGRLASPALGNIHLTDALVVDTVDDLSQDAAGAIAYVEAKMLDAYDHVGGAGTIYLNPVMAVRGSDAIDWNDFSDLRTNATRSKVVIGNFADMVVYGHVGEVELYVSPPEIVEQTQTADNSYLVQAEQVVVVAWNPCAAFKQSTATLPPV